MAPNSWEWEEWGEERCSSHRAQWQRPQRASDSVWHLLLGTEGTLNFQSSELSRARDRLCSYGWRSWKGHGYVLWPSVRAKSAWMFLSVMIQAMSERQSCLRGQPGGTNSFLERGKTIQPKGCGTDRSRQGQCRWGNPSNGEREVLQGIHTSTLRNTISLKPLPSREWQHGGQLGTSALPSPLPHSITCLGSQYLVGDTEENRGERSHSHFSDPQQLGERKRPQDFKPSSVFLLLFRIDILVHQLGLRISQEWQTRWW